MQSNDQASFESRKQAVAEGDTSGSGKWKMWKAAIDAALSRDEDWRKEGARIEEVYEGEPVDSDEMGFMPSDEFNILYSNTETLTPALYNSTPIPDIRRRYNDPGKAAKAVADILDRAIQYQLDTYNFDGEVLHLVNDLALPGRGCCRVRYEPVVEDGMLKSQSVKMEWVPWRNLIIGPGDTWRDVDWICFQHFLTKEELTKLLKQGGSSVSIDDVKLDQDTSDDDTDDDEAETAEGDIFKRALVYEIWDKVERKVLFMADSYPDGLLLEMPDTLKLSGFWPVPQPVSTGNVMEPVPFYRAYKVLAEELNEVTRRISKLVAQCRYRGIYLSSNQDAENLFTADDGDFVPVQGLEQWINNGGIEKAILFFPLDPLVKALQQLYQSRDQIKQTIYEVSGLSDILRGASQASETATAQQIKTQWGSLRIQRAQAEVQRLIRDVFRIKAEIIANHFDLDLLSQMTGVQLIKQQQLLAVQQQVQAQQQPMQGQGQPQGPSQAPQAPPVDPQLQAALDLPVYEEVQQMLQDDVLRQYKIDIESDSTIRADLSRNQETMAQFVQGTAAFIQAIGPAVQSGVMPGSTAVAIFSAFCRNFRLGRQVDTELEKLAEDAEKKANAPPPPAPPDPEQMKAQAAMQQAQQQAQLEQQRAQQQAQLEQAKAERQALLEHAKASKSVEIEQTRAHADIEAQRQKTALEMQAATHKAKLDAATRIREHRMKMLETRANLHAERQKTKMGLYAAKTNADAKSRNADK